MDFVDFVNIKIESGNGGDGAIHFRREKYVPDGGPSGGDGGNGGSVIIEADSNLHTLLDFRFKHKFAAEHGENGRPKNQYGKKGRDLIVKVPQGTLIKDKETGRVIADLTENNQTFVAAKGGRGGRGNTKFATSINKAPHYSEPGGSGEKRELTLELKSIADVGLVGLPNAGKSSLLSVISSAKPKIANYPFTTLTPNLGVVKLPDGDGFIVADIPGLIEGAHNGIGLGHKFLRHIERTRLLVHLVDISSENPWFDYETINHELVLYPGDVQNKIRVVVLNKTDLMLQDDIEIVQEEFKEQGITTFVASTATKHGVDELIKYIAGLLPSIPKPEPVEIEDDDFDMHQERDVFEIIKEEDDVFAIESERIQKLLQLTDIGNVRALNRFMKILTGAGVIEKLKELKAKEGDTVKIGEFQFEYFPDEPESEENF